LYLKRATLYNERAALRFHGHSSSDLTWHLGGVAPPYISARVIAMIMGITLFISFAKS